MPVNSLFVCTIKRAEISLFGLNASTMRLIQKEISSNFVYCIRSVKAQRVKRTIVSNTNITPKMTCCSDYKKN